MAYYARPDEDLAQTATVVTASAEDAEYPAEHLITEDPAEPAKLTTNTGSWVLEFAAKVAPIAMALLYQYLDAGLNVRLQGNDTDSWGSPAFDQAITIPAKRKDGPSYQPWTVSPWMLLDELDDEDGYLFWRLVIVGTNSQVIAVGRLFLASALHEVELFASSRPMPEDDTAGEIVHPTELNVETIYDLGGPRRGMSIMRVATDLSAGTTPIQLAQAFRDLSESLNGRQKSFLFIPFEYRNDACLVRPESAVHGRTHHVGGYQEWPLDVREVSRGLPFP